VRVQQRNIGDEDRSPEGAETGPDREEWGWVMAPEVKHLPSTYEVLNPNNKKTVGVQRLQCWTLIQTRKHDDFQVLDTAPYLVPSLPSHRVEAARHCAVGLLSFLFFFFWQRRTH
jgi:hypothetical protein